MKKLTGALVLSFSLLLASGCRSAGETKDPEDASTPAGAVDAAKGALNNGSAGTPTEPAKPAPGVDVGGMKSDSGSSTPLGSDPAAATPAAMPMADDVRAAKEACVDKWLNGKKMDRYGHPEGTMYMGGSPLFNEATGESKDRLEYVFQRQPEAKKACGDAGTKK